MQTISLRINERSIYGKAIMDLIKIGINEKKGVEMVKVPNKETLEAMEDIEKGKTYKVKDSKELFKELGI
jgi:hypothetical protein